MAKTVNYTVQRTCALGKEKTKVSLDPTRGATKAYIRSGLIKSPNSPTEKKVVEPSEPAGVSVTVKKESDPKPAKKKAASKKK